MDAVPAVATLRAATAQATGAPCSQACPITAVRLKLGTINDPLVIATKDSILWFLQVWFKWPQNRGMISLAWPKIREPIIATGKVEWAKARGPIGTLIGNLAARVRKDLETYLVDNCQSWLLQADGMAKWRADTSKLPPRRPAAGAPSPRCAATI